MKKFAVEYIMHDSPTVVDVIEIECGEMPNDELGRKLLAEKLGKDTLDILTFDFLACEIPPEQEPKVEYPFTKTVSGTLTMITVAYQYLRPKINCEFDGIAYFYADQPFLDVKCNARLLDSINHQLKWHLKNKEWKLYGEPRITSMREVEGFTISTF